MTINFLILFVSLAFDFSEPWTTDNKIAFLNELERQEAEKYASERDVNSVMLYSAENRVRALLFLQNGRSKISFTFTPPSATKPNQSVELTSDNDTGGYTIINMD
jgi:hypothetical protein